MTQARKNLLLVACILVVCAVGPRLFSSAPGAPEPTAAPATPKPVELSAEASALKEIRAGYDRMDAAIKAKDSKGYMAVLAPEYTMVLKDGRVDDRAKTEASLSESLNKMKYVTFAVGIQHATVQGHSAHVKQEQTLTATVIDHRGKEHAFYAKGKFEDTWTLRSDGWKLAKQMEVSSTFTIDGKSVDEPAPTASP